MNSMKHFEFRDKNYDDKKIVIEITEDSIDIAIFDITEVGRDPIQMKRENGYTSAVILKEDLETPRLVIKDGE